MEKLEETDEVALMAGITSIEFRAQRKKINELVDDNKELWKAVNRLEKNRDQNIGALR